MNNQEEVLDVEAPARSLTVQDDPFQKSFEDSAIQYFPYRIFLIFVALGFLQLGKSSLPEDAVPCIQDMVNTALQPVATFFNDTRGFGLTLMTIMQLLCDIQLVGMVVYWVVWGRSFTYPLSVGFLAISKVLVNVFFHFIWLRFFSRLTKWKIPSRTDGITAFLVMNLLEFWNFGFKKLFYAQIPIMIFVMFLLLAMRLNFFMDVVTALAFGYIVYSLIDSKREPIDAFLLNPRQKFKDWVRKNESDSASTNQN